MRRNALIHIEGETGLLRIIYEKMKEHVLSIRLLSELPYYKPNDRDWLKIELYTDSSYYIELTNLINEYNLKSRYLEVREYSKEERNNADYYDLLVAWPWEHEAKDAEDYGTLYNYENVCNHCGEGKEQSSILYIDAKKMRHHNIATIYPEIIVNEQLMKAIVDERLTGCELIKAQDYKHRDCGNYYQMVIKSVLGSMNNQIRLEYTPNYCNVCGRKGKYLRSEVIYSADNLSDAKDFNLSSEYFYGEGNRPGIQSIIVTSRVYRLFKGYKFKTAYFEPVKVI